MKVKGLVIASLALIAAMVAFAFYVNGTMPAGAQLPVHFNSAGEPDRYGDALVALLIAPGALLFTTLILAVTPQLEPLQDKLAQSAPLLRTVWVGIMGVMVFMQISIAAPALGWNLPPRLFYVVLGLFLISIGNTLPKSRPGFFVGIRTPWTIMDTDIWIATHRLGGKLMMAAGAIVAINGLVTTSQGLAVALLIGPMLLAVAVPVFYSWWLWRQKQTRGS